MIALIIFLVLIFLGSLLYLLGYYMDKKIRKEIAIHNSTVTSGEEVSLTFEEYSQLLRNKTLFKNGKTIVMEEKTTN